MKTHEEDDVPAPDVPDAIANAWAAVYVDVAEKLDSTQQFAPAANVDAQLSEPGEAEAPQPIPTTHEN